MVRLRPAVLPGLGASAPISNVSATEWNVARSDINVLAALRFDPDHPNYGAVRGDASITPGASVMAANRAAIQLAADDAKDTGGTLVIKGTYWVDDTINVQSHMDGSSGYLITQNSAINPLMRVGDPASGGWIAGLNIIVPQLRQANKPTAPGWNASDCGVEFVNLNACHVTTQRITNFSTNLRGTASGTGLVYNAFTLGWMENGKVNFHLNPPGPGLGWIQENIFINGRFHHNGGEGTNVSGARHILLDDLVGNNVFLKPSIEGNVAEYHVDCGGSYNQFNNARYEANPPRVRFTATSHSNVIQYGWGSQNIQLTDTGNYNHLYTRNGMRIKGSGHGVFTGSTEGWGPGVFVATVSGLADPETEYGASIGPRYTRFKNPVNAFPRIEIDGYSSTISMGNGSAAPTAYIGTYGATGIAITGEFLNLPSTRIGFFGKAPVVQPAANPDTSGATLAALETEVNQLKAALRALGLIAT